MAGKGRSLNEMLKRGGYNSNNIAVTGHGDEEDYIDGLPPALQEASAPVLQRVKALKKLQLSSLEVEAQFYSKVHELEIQFAPKFDEIGEKRRAIVTGSYEPDNYECDIPLINDFEPEQLQRVEENAPSEDNPSKGIPSFWFHVLKSTQIADDIFDCDEPILKDYLEDVTTEVYSNPPGFSLFFHFAPNPYFSNQVLKKYYQLEIGLPAIGGDENPFNYDGPTILRCVGCEIDWSPGKNVTVKIIKKAPKKGPNAGKPMTKTVSNDSFFNFFSPKVTEEQPDMDPESEEALHKDFEIGQILRDEIIPRAVLYFTGEAAEDIDEDDFFEDEDENDDAESHGDE